MAEHITVIESPEYADDARKLMQNAKIIDMAESLKAHGQVDDYLNDPESMRVAYDEANRRNIPFRFIGSPHRALVALLTKEEA